MGPTADCTVPGGCIPLARVKVKPSWLTRHDDGTLELGLTPMAIVKLKTELEYALESLRAA